MKKIISRLLAVALAILLGFTFVTNSFAEDEEEEATTGSTGASISLMPVNKILQIASDSVYDESLTVNNDGDGVMKIEVYAAPYSYVYSNEENQYKLGFSNENNYTQLSRWITFKDANGDYVEKAQFSIDPHESLEVKFRISTPASIPGGGQYAVIFAHTISTAVSANGIRTEASPGMVIYGRSTEGEAIVDVEFSDLKISEEGGDIVATAKVKNGGNVDFNAKGTLKVEPIIGFNSYETPANAGRLSVIPETELTVSSTWENAPSFGIYKATWTVKVGDETETIEKTIVRAPLFAIVLIIILLTILTIWIIISVRRRKERRSRLAI